MQALVIQAHLNLNFMPNVSFELFFFFFFEKTRDASFFLLSVSETTGALMTP